MPGRNGTSKKQDAEASNDRTTLIGLVHRPLVFPMNLFAHGCFFRIVAARTLRLP
jgi:hypothetical protein